MLLKAEKALLLQLHDIAKVGSQQSATTNHFLQTLEPCAFLLACRAPACSLPAATAASAARRAGTAKPRSASAKLCRQATKLTCLGPRENASVRAPVRQALACCVSLLTAASLSEACHRAAITSCPDMMSLAASTPVAAQAAINAS